MLRRIGSLLRQLEKPISGMDRWLALIRWMLPASMVVIVAVYELTEHVLLEHEGLSPAFWGEILFFGVMGPVISFLVLGWIHRQWQARVADQRTLEEMHRHLLEAQVELERLHAQRGHLLRHLIRAQEEERKRVAREIHDELGQVLTRLGINLSLCAQQIPESSETLKAQLKDTQALVDRTMGEVHHLILELRPRILDELGLEAALREELRQRLRQSGIETSLQVQGDLSELPVEISTTLFRVAQEALSNVLRHARAGRVSVQIGRQDDLVHMVIEDDGVGIPASLLERLDGTQAWGLLGMRERVQLLNGKLQIERGVPQGTRICLQIPLFGEAE